MVRRREQPRSVTGVLGPCDDLLGDDPLKVYPIGSTVSFTLSTRTWSTEPTTHAALIDYRWSLDLTSFTEDDYPLAPGSGYTMHGRVLSAAGDHLILDCGLVIKVTTGHRLTLPPVQPGDLLCVQGHLYINRAMAEDGVRPKILRRRPPDGQSVPDDPQT